MILVDKLIEKFKTVMVMKASNVSDLFDGI